MEFGDDSKIFNHYSGEVFRQFPKRGRQMKRVRKLFLRCNLRTFSSNRADVDRVDRWKWI